MTQDVTVSVYFFSVIICVKTEPDTVKFICTSVQIILTKTRLVIILQSFKHLLAQLLFSTGRAKNEAQLSALQLQIVI